MNELIIFLTTFIISLVLTPFIKHLAVKRQVYAAIREDRWHKKPIPFLGGIAIFSSAFFSIAFFLPHTTAILGFLICSFIIFILGLLDDFFKFPPQVKLLGQILVACLAVIFGINFSGIPVQFAFLSIILSIIWITGIINSFNLLDNMDGLSCGIAAICAFILFNLTFDNQILSTIALILCGSALGFLPYNFNPARIFMGDSGSMFLGFSLASLSIMGSSRHASNLLFILLVPVLILIVPIFDTALVMIIRKFHGKKISQGGKDHTSHRLVALGLTERKTVLILYLFSAVFGFITLSCSKANIGLLGIVAFLAAGILLYFGMFLAETEKKPSSESNNKAKKERVLLNTVILNKRRILEIIADFLFISVSFYLAYFLRFEGNISTAHMQLLSSSLPWIIPLKLILFYYFGIYKGVWRYIGIYDLASIFKAVTASSAAIILILTFTARFQDYSRVVFVLDWMILLFLVAGSRIFMRTLMEYFSKLSKGKKNIIIVGAGDRGEILLREINRNKNLNYKVIGFVDDNLKKIGSRIHGLSVLGTKEDIPKICKKYNIDTALITISPHLKDSITEIRQICQNSGIEHHLVKGMLEL